MFVLKTSGMVFVVILLHLIVNITTALIDSAYNEAKLQPKDVATQEGGSIKLNCSAPYDYRKRHFIFNITLSHNGSVIGHDTTSELFKDEKKYLIYKKENATWADAGRYVCEINKGRDRKINDTTTVTIARGDHMAILLPHHVVTQEGGHIELTCSPPDMYPILHPRNTYTLLHNGLVVTNVATSEFIKDDKEYCIYKKENASPADAGRYMCVINKGREGEINATAIVDVIGDDTRATLPPFDVVTHVEASGMDSAAEATEAVISTSVVAIAIVTVVFLVF